MLLGLADAGSTATVSPGAKGSAVVTQPGKRTVIQLAPIAITGKVPKKKPSVPAAAPALVVPGKDVDFASKAAGFFGGAESARNLVLAVGVLGLGAWLVTTQTKRGGILAGLMAPPGKRRRRRVARNPRASVDHPDPLVRKAIKFRQDFHWGIPAKRIARRRISPRPDVLVSLGKLVSVTYETHKQGERARLFEHEFEGVLPTLGMDIRNKRLHVVGGTYTVTDDGITG